MLKKHKRVIVKRPHWQDTKYTSRCQLSGLSNISVSIEGTGFRWVMETMGYDSWTYKSGIKKDKDAAKRAALKAYRGIIEYYSHLRE